MESDPDVISRRITLSQWILKFDKYLLSNPKLYEYIKEYFFESYKNCSELRKEFHNDFLPKLESELGFPSKKEFYDYNNFFKIQNYDKFDLADFYYYDDDLNLYNRNNNNLKSTKNKKEKIKNLNKNINPLPKDSSYGGNKYAENDEESDKNKKDKNQNLNIIPMYNASDYEESYKETISNNMETYGKQIEDTDEYSESKKNEQSNKSLKRYQDIGEKNENQKAYFSKRLPNFTKKVQEGKKQKWKNYNSLNVLNNNK